MNDTTPTDEQRLDRLEERAARVTALIEECRELLAEYLTTARAKA